MGAKSDLVRYESLAWIKCGDCGAGFQTPYVGELDRDEDSSDGDIHNTYANYLRLPHVFDAVAREKAEWVSRATPEDFLFIELGPGAGAVARQLRSLRPNEPYIGIEPNPEFAQNLAKEGFEAYSGDPAEALSKAVTKARASGRKAMIVMDNVLEHIPFPKELHTKLLDEAPAGSRVAIEVPNEFGIRWKARVQDMLRGERKAPTFPGHINLFTKPSLGRMLREAGLREVEVRYRGIRNLNQVTYLSQSTDYTPQTKLAVLILKTLQVDYMLGVPYWLRATATL